MNLEELKRSVDRSFSYANECGIEPSTVAVSVQIEDTWSSDVELHYDNDCQASGCVLVGNLPFPRIKER